MATIESLAEEAARICERIQQDGAPPGTKFPNLHKLIQEVLGAERPLPTAKEAIRTLAEHALPPVHYENDFEDRGTVKMCRTCGAFWQKTAESLFRKTAK